MANETDIRLLSSESAALTTLGSVKARYATQPVVKVKKARSPPTHFLGSSPQRSFLYNKDQSD